MLSISFLFFFFFFTFFLSNPVQRIWIFLTLTAWGCKRVHMTTEIWIFSGLLDPFCHCGILAPLGSAPTVLESESPSSLSRWGKGSLFYGSIFSRGPNGYRSREQTLPTSTEPFLPGCKHAAGTGAGKAEGATPGILEPRWAHPPLLEALFFLLLVDSVNLLSSPSCQAYPRVSSTST